MTITQKVQNLNNAQHEYAVAKGNAKELLHQISRALLDSPSAANGNWGLVGDMKHLVDELTEIKDRIYKTGEYAE